MKNITIYKKALSLLTATAISLTMASCSRKENTKETTPQVETNDNCTHLSLCIGGVYETFKECDGYDICLKTNYGSGIYSISKDDRLYLSGVTTDYNIIHINHNLYQSENKALQKVKTKD